MNDETGATHIRRQELIGSSANYTGINMSKAEPTSLSSGLESFNDFDFTVAVTSMQDEPQHAQELASRRIGKRVGDHLYVHVSAFSTLSPDQQSIIAQASELAHLTNGAHFNVVKLSQQGNDLSLLDYPSFFDDPFPTLTRSWRISLSRKTVVFRNYEESRNPPILHRKERLLQASDPRVPEFSLITESAESLGLFDEPNRI